MNKRLFCLLIFLLSTSMAYSDSEVTVGGKTGAAHIIQDEGVSLRPRPYLNFTGSGASCADDGGKTVCTITGGGGGASNLIVQEEDVTSGASSDTLDFREGFDLTQNPANETNIALNLSEVMSGAATADSLNVIYIADNYVLNTTDSMSGNLSVGGNIDSYGTYEAGTSHITITTADGHLDGEQIDDNSIDVDSLDWGAFTDLGESGVVEWGNITEGELADSTVVSDDIKNGTIAVGDMAANSIDSDQYVDGSIDAIHLAADVIDETKLADDSIDSEHYNDGSIDHEHLAADVISGMTDVTSEDSDYMLIWDATDSALKKVDMGEVRGGGSATAYDDIGDPDANGTIAFKGYTNDWTSSLADTSFFTISNAAADVTGDSYLVTLKYVDDDDANAHFIRMIDDSNVNSDVLFQVDYDGSTTIAGDLTSSGAITGESLTIESNTIDLGDATEDYVLTFNAATNTWSGEAAAGGGDLLADGTVPLTADWDAGDYTITSANVTVDNTLTVGGASSVVVGAVTWNNGDYIEGESIKDDTIDDDSIDFSDVTCADLTTTDCGNITSTGVVDLGGATSFEIPNGDPTVDAAGEIGVDTTDDQLVYYGGAKRVLAYEQEKSFAIESLAAADDNKPCGSFTDDVTITSTWCTCHGTCTTPAQITLDDDSGNAFTMATTVCVAAGSIPTAATVTTDTLTARESMRFSVINTPDPETDDYIYTYTYTIDAK